MPMVEGKKFPYTAAGMKAAKKANKKHEKSEGKMERMVEYGAKKKVAKKVALSPTFLFLLCYSSVIYQVRVLTPCCFGSRLGCSLLCWSQWS